MRIHHQEVHPILVSFVTLVNIILKIEDLVEHRYLDTLKFISSVDKITLTKIDVMNLYWEEVQQESNLRVIHHV